MVKSNYKVIGVMSGTSLDGIDLVYVEFEVDKVWTFTIQSSNTFPYPDEWKAKLKNLVLLSPEKLKALDIEYTDYLASVIVDFIKKHNITKLDAICSHGHTALHQPSIGLTYQIGNLSLLSTLTKHTVVCDFRVQDVALGGQGAPLVPVGDRLLFSAYDFCLNLGGFANISMEAHNHRTAFDICPVNIVLNRYAEILGQPFDGGGVFARSGTLNVKLLNSLNNIEFYKQPPPKSLGAEWVNSTLLPLLTPSGQDPKTLLRTFTEHIAIQIANVLNTSEGNKKVLVTGGGAYNTFLLERLALFSKHSLVIPSKELIEYKEALIFALLGVLKLRNETNCLKSVTGASKNHSSGVIFTP
ncbi:MAG TPA: anhydro-N-acetylmuramic acid kinase [Flavobacteriaceae bacterium]|nr:anhydro-N-acetylmuramic acid kinase [Flavobacteriaceae bacterium]